MIQVEVKTNCQLEKILSNNKRPVNVIGVMLLPEYPKEYGFTIEQFQNRCVKSLRVCRDSFTTDSAVYFVLNFPIKIQTFGGKEFLRSYLEQKLGDLNRKVEYDFRFIVQKMS